MHIELRRKRLSLVAFNGRPDAVHEIDGLYSGQTVETNFTSATPLAKAALAARPPRGQA